MLVMVVFFIAFRWIHLSTPLIRLFLLVLILLFFFFQAEDGIRVLTVTGVQTCALPISREQVADEKARLGVAEPRRTQGVELGVPHRHRSEERRVGKECRSWFSAYLLKNNVTPASSAPVLQTTKATSSTIDFDSLTVNVG